VLESIKMISLRFAVIFRDICDFTHF